MNAYLAYCIKDSLWRKALGIIDCFEEHGLVPSTRTFEILLDCCRHSLEEPAVWWRRKKYQIFFYVKSDTTNSLLQTIFETLRLHDLPREFCYKAAVVNAGNRMSPQVALENLYEINKNPSFTGWEWLIFLKSYFRCSIFIVWLYSLGGKTPSFEYGKTYMFPIYRKTYHAGLPVDHCFKWLLFRH